jgi:hypothetical protein
MKPTPRQAQTWRWNTERDELGVELDLEAGVLRWFSAPRVLADAPMSAQDGWEQPLDEWLGGAPSPVDCPAHVAGALRAAGPRERRRRARRSP